MGGGGGQTFGETPEFNYIESLYVREGERSPRIKGSILEHKKGIKVVLQGSHAWGAAD